MSDPTSASEFLLTFLREAEGLRTRSYADLGGKVTIGYGHLCPPTKTTPAIISLADAEDLLLEDVAEAQAGVARCVGEFHLFQRERDALTSFVFNLGEGRLAESTLLQYILAGRPLDAAREFRKWSHVGTYVVPGLLRRRVAEELWFLGGNLRSVMDVLKNAWPYTLPPAPTETV